AYLLLTDDVDLEQISDSAFLICELLPFINNGDQIRRSIYLLECSLFNMYSKKQEKIIDEGIMICRRNCWIFLGFCGASLISWAIKPFFGTNIDYPCKFGYLTTLQRGPNVLAIGDAPISNGVLDPLVAGLAGLATSQFKLLKDNLQSLGEYAENSIFNICKGHEKMSFDEKNQLEMKIVYERIELCISHHNAILNRFYSVYVKRCCDLCFLFTDKCGNTIISYFFCHVEFSHHDAWRNIFSNSLANAVYMGQWYEYEIKCKKALLILMERSKKPTIITAGKILELS
ncbi:7tm 6 domain containing protein, partial [Asbolus verrucosus]